MPINPFFPDALPLTTARLPGLRDFNPLFPPRQINFSANSRKLAYSEILPAAGVDEGEASRYRRRQAPRLAPTEDTLCGGLADS